MAEVVVTRAWRYRLFYALLCFTIIFVHLLPFDAGTSRLPGPDMVLAFTLAWVMRRPDYVPVLLVAAVILTTDVFFLRPLGLWTAVVILGVEFLRAREPYSRDLPFLLEWLMVALTIVTMTLGYMLVLAIFAVDQPALGLSLLQMVMTIFAYPVAVLFSARLFGLRKMPPGAVDQLGHRL